MSISDSDITHLYSTSAGSTGGVITGSGPTSGVKNDVWPDISSVSRLAGGVLYRKTFFKNNHGTDAMALPVLYTPVLPTNMTLQIGLGVDASTDDDSAQGNMTAFGAAALVSLISDGADTRVCTIYGMNNAGTPVPTSEQVTLTGAVEVLSVNTYSKCWAVIPASTSGTRIVTVKQGAGGTVRGTIGINKRLCWLWVTAGTALANGIGLVNLAAGQNYGVWRKLSWTAAVGAVKPNTLDVAITENN